MNTFYGIGCSHKLHSYYRSTVSPMRAFRFIDIPLNELTNQGIDSQEFPVLFSQSFIYQLCESNQNPIDTIEYELVRQVYKNNTDTEKQISYAVSLISRQKGIVSIKELATEACLCLLTI